MDYVNCFEKLYKLCSNSIRPEAGLNFHQVGTKIIRHRRIYLVRFLDASFLLPRQPKSACQREKEISRTVEREGN